MQIKYIYISIKYDKFNIILLAVGVRDSGPDVYGGGILAGDNAVGQMVVVPTTGTYSVFLPKT